eukprot:2151984-Prymnesium_polylepis.1
MEGAFLERFQPPVHPSTMNQPASQPRAHSANCVCCVVRLYLALLSVSAIAASHTTHKGCAKRTNTGGMRRVRGSGAADVRH